MTIEQTSDIFPPPGLPDALPVDFVASSVADAPPVAADDALAAGETALISGNVFADHGAGVDHDPEGGALRVVAVLGQASYVGLGLDLVAGRVRILADGAFWFDTAKDFGHLIGGETVQVSFDYTIADAGGATDTATATVTITGANDAPTLYPDFVYANETGVAHINVFAFNGVGADADPEGARLRIVDFMGGTAAAGAQATLPDGGLVRLNADGSLWFRADGAYDHMKPGEVEEVIFTYRATDGQYTRTSHVTLIIEGRNTAPVARPDFFTTNEERTVGRHLFDDNGAGADGDIEGDAFSVLEVNRDKAQVGVSFDLAEGGRLRVNADGRFWFNPLDDFDHLGDGETETVSFTYTIDDHHGGYSRATVEIVVAGISYLSVAARDNALNVQENGPVRGLDFLADDYENPDDEPDVIAVSFATSGPGTYDGPIGGSLTLNADGRSFTFDPGDDFDYLRKNQRAEFSFAYEIEDRNGDRSTGTVDIDVVGANDKPVALDDHFVWSLSGGNATMNIFDDNGSGADYDVDIGDALEVRSFKPTTFSVYRQDGSWVNPSAGGSVTIMANGDVLVSADWEPDYYTGGRDLEAGRQIVLDYRIQDDFEGQSVEAQVHIDIIA